MSGHPLQRAARGLARGLDAALTREEDARALGLLRIAVASVLLVSLLAHVGSVGAYFSDESTIAGRFARLAFPDRASLFLPARRGQEDAWYAALYVADPTVVRAVFAVGVLAHIGWIVGAFTWVCGIACYVLWMSLVGRNPMLYAYPDQLGVMLCFLLAIVPCGRGLSVDAWRRRKRGLAPRTVPVWCRRLIALQLAIVYVSTGLAKSGKTWHEEGTALYYTLANPYNRHFAATGLWASLQPWVLKPATWITLWWEVSFGVFVVHNWVREVIGTRRWWPDLRWVFLGWGVVVHGGVQLFLYTVVFSPLILSAYLCFFTWDDIERLRAWWRRRRRGRRKEPRTDAG